MNPQRMRYHFEIPLTFHHQVFFTRGAFRPENEVLSDFLPDGECKVLVFLESEISRVFPNLESQIRFKFGTRIKTQFCGIHKLTGGEGGKVNPSAYESVCDEIAAAGIDRHSYVFAIGGGAFLDVVGFAAATVHRGVRLVRFPTTTLSQDDSGVGVKSGINKYGKKNFMGAFAVPYAVVNDFEFLHTQPEGIRRDGLVEAVKVSLVKDGDFFRWLERNLESLARLDERTLEEAVERSAILHARHIAEGGDPFESGSSRPLDFGHWSAHKLEQLSGFALSHAKAVAIGLAVDSLYSVQKGFLKREDCERILRVLEGLALPIWSELLELRDDEGELAFLSGLQEFREHLGGELTVLLLQQPGIGIEVHEMDCKILGEVVGILKERALSAA